MNTAQEALCKVQFVINHYKGLFIHCKKWQAWNVILSSNLASCVSGFVFLFSLYYVTVQGHSFANSSQLNLFNTVMCVFKTISKTCNSIFKIASRQFFCVWCNFPEKSYIILKKLHLLIPEKSCNPSSRSD